MSKRKYKNDNEAPILAISDQVPDEYKHHLFQPRMTPMEVLYLEETVPYLKDNKIFKRLQNGKIQLDKNGMPCVVNVDVDKTQCCVIHDTEITFREAILNAYIIIKGILRSSPIKYLRSEEYRNSKQTRQNPTGDQFTEREQKAILIALVSTFKAPQSACFMDTNTNTFKLSDVDDTFGAYFLEDLFVSCVWLHGLNGKSINCVEASVSERTEWRNKCRSVYRSTFVNTLFLSQVKYWRSKGKQDSEIWDLDYIRANPDSSTTGAYFHYIKYIDLIIHNMRPKYNEYSTTMMVNDVNSKMAFEWQNTNKRQWHVNPRVRERVGIIEDQYADADLHFPTTLDTFPNYHVSDSDQLRAPASSIGRGNPAGSTFLNRTSILFTINSNWRPPLFTAVTVVRKNLETKLNQQVYFISKNSEGQIEFVKDLIVGATTYVLDSKTTCWALSTYIPRRFSSTGKGENLSAADEIFNMQQESVSVRVKLIGWGVRPASGGQASAHVVTAAGDVMEFVPLNLLQSTMRHYRAGTGITIEDISDRYNPPNKVRKQLHGSSVHCGVVCRIHVNPSRHPPVLELNFLLNKRMIIRGTQYNGKCCKVVEVYPGGCSVIVDGIASTCPDINWKYLRLVDGDGNESLPCTGVRQGHKIVRYFTTHTLQTIVGKGGVSDRVHRGKPGRDPPGTKIP